MLSLFFGNVWVLVHGVHICETVVVCSYAHFCVYLRHTALISESTAFDQERKFSQNGLSVSQIDQHLFFRLLRGSTVCYFIFFFFKMDLVQSL